MDASVGMLLDHWFDGNPSDCKDTGALMKKWFAGTEEQDRELRERFGAMVEAAAAGELNDWAEQPRGRLALIILLDQLPRNLHRGTPAAFRGDGKALELCLEGLEASHDEHLHPLERVFFLMPLQHAESPEIQARSVEAFEELAAIDTAPAISAVLRTCADYAAEHRDLIRRFGRFPYRNAVLGRESTELELEFLAAGGPRYGQ